MGYGPIWACTCWQACIHPTLGPYGIAIWAPHWSIMGLTVWDPYGFYMGVHMRASPFTSHTGPCGLAIWVTCHHTSEKQLKISTSWKILLKCCYQLAYFVNRNILIFLDFFLPYLILVKYTNACFNIVATLTVRCLCVCLSGFSCPDYCFEA